VFILKTLKVIYFEALLQVFILKVLRVCTKIVQFQRIPAFGEQKSSLKSRPKKQKRQQRMPALQDRAQYYPRNIVREGLLFVKRKKRIFRRASKGVKWVAKWNLRVGAGRLTGRGELAVPAAEEEQGLTRKQIGALHFTQKDSVVSRDVGGNDPAHDLGESVFKERYADWRPAVANAQLRFRLAGLLGLREVHGDCLLAFLQDVDAEIPSLFEKRKQMAALIHANESQKRVEGDRGKGIGGHAIGLSRGLG